jgi:hypothetical protein
VTRVVLCASLSALTLVLALCTALVQNGNRERGIELNALKEECSMLEAINGDRLERILEKDWGALPYTPRPGHVATSAKPAHAPSAVRGGKADS